MWECEWDGSEQIFLLDFYIYFDIRVFIMYLLQLKAVYAIHMLSYKVNYYIP
jgi:hypothetical protein